MDGGSWHCTGDRDQDHSQEKEMQKNKKQEITSVREGVEKLEHLCTVGGNVKWYTCYRKQ